MNNDRFGIEEYNRKLKEEADRSFDNYKDELRAILFSDIETLMEEHGMEEGEGIHDYIHNFDNQGKFEPISGYRLNRDFNVQALNDDNAYVLFERSTESKWIIGQFGQVYITYSQQEVKNSFESLGNDFENSELYDYINNRVAGLDFENYTLPFNEDEHIERLKDDLCVRDQAEWILREANQYDTQVVPFENLVGCLKERGYDLDKAVELVLDNGAYNACDDNGIAFSKEDFLNDIRTHQKTLEELVETDHFEDLQSVFYVDSDLLTEFDEDYCSKELDREFGSEIKNNKKVKVKI